VHFSLIILTLGTNVSAMKHVPFLNTDIPPFTEAKIILKPLTIISNKVPKLESLGIGNQLAVNQTKDLISVIRAHISYSVSFHIFFLFLTTMLTITFRPGVAYWSMQFYCMLHQI
jgi:hypothetical protein